MAEEDLDAFFDEVEEVEATAVKEDETKSTDEAPPAKKQKVSSRPPVRRGVVVAASAAAVSTPSPAITAASSGSVPPLNAPSNSKQDNIGPAATHASLPPPPPPPRSSIAPPPPPPPPPAQQKPHVRTAAGKKWIDAKIGEWPDDDFRLFVGNLGNEVTDQMLLEHFSAKYPTCLRARVIRDAKQPDKSKGYGFVSLTDPLECARAMREMDQTWLGARPIRVKRSQWQEREAKGKKKSNKKKR